MVHDPPPPANSLAHPKLLKVALLIAPHATVSPNTVLGRFSFINRAASIGHDVYIGEYSRVGPSAAIAAFCRIGCRTSVNIGATVIDRIHIGDNSVVGASVLVTRDLPDNVVAFGTPVKKSLKINHWKISTVSASNYMNSLLSRFKINQP